MRVDVEIRGQLGRGHAPEASAHQPRCPAAELEHEDHEQHVAPTHQRVGAPRRDPPSELFGQSLARGHGHDVGGRALEHRHVLGPFGRQRGDQGDGRGAAADHHDPLTAAVEVRRPMLGVHDLPGEVLAAGEVGAVALVVAVVAGAHVQEGAGQPHLLAGVAAARGHRPARLLGGPAGADRPVGEADPLLHPVGLGGVADIAEDRGSVGDPTGILPGAEGIAHREHVGVRADAGIAEQVPGAPDLLTRLEDRDRGTGEGAAQVAGGADPRQAGAEDQHVEVLHARGTPHLRRLAQQCHEGFFYQPRRPSARVSLRESTACHASRTVVGSRTTAGQKVPCPSNSHTPTTVALSVA